MLHLIGTKKFLTVTLYTPDKKLPTIVYTIYIKQPYDKEKTIFIHDFHISLLGSKALSVNSWIR